MGGHAEVSEETGKGPEKWGGRARCYAGLSGSLYWAEKDWSCWAVPLLDETVHGGLYQLLPIAEWDAYSTRLS